MKGPTFLVIGPGRTGTTLLYEVLLRHPQVCLARQVKETNFFNDNYEKGLDWYEAFFPDTTTARAVGEISNLYFYHPEVPRRIHRHFPGIRLVSILRNPYERLLSVVRFRQRTGQIPPDLPLQKALDQFPDLLTQNDYALHLSHYLDLFPRDQLWVGNYDDLRERPRQFFQDLFQFIGVDPLEIPVPSRRINPSGRLRWGLLGGGIRKTADFLRRREWFALLNGLKRSALLQKLLYRATPVETDQLEAQIPPEVIPTFNTYLEAAEALLGRDFSGWKRTPVTS